MRLRRFEQSALEHTRGNNVFGWNNHERHFGGRGVWETAVGFWRHPSEGGEGHFRIGCNSLTWFAGPYCLSGALTKHLQSTVQLRWPVSVSVTLSPASWFLHCCSLCLEHHFHHPRTWLMPNYPSDPSSSATSSGEPSQTSKTGAIPFVHTITWWMSTCPSGS